MPLHQGLAVFGQESISVSVQHQCLCAKPPLPSSPPHTHGTRPQLLCHGWLGLGCRDSDIYNLKRHFVPRAIHRGQWYTVTVLTFESVYKRTGLDRTGLGGGYGSAVLGGDGIGENRTEARQDIVVQ